MQCIEAGIGLSGQAGGGGDRERVAECVGVLEGNRLPAADRAAVVHKAVVEADAAKDLWID